MFDFLGLERIDDRLQGRPILAERKGRKENAQARKPRGKNLRRLVIFLHATLLKTRSRQKASRKCRPFHPGGPAPGGHGYAIQPGNTRKENARTPRKGYLPRGLDFVSFSLIGSRESGPLSRNLLKHRLNVNSTPAPGTRARSIPPDAAPPAFSAGGRARGRTSSARKPKRHDADLPVITSFELSREKPRRAKKSFRRRKK